MTELSVNLNKVALVRNARTLDIPSVTKSALICIDAGAYGITVHPRPDERHIRYSDVYDLVETIAGRSVEFNIEGNPFTGRYMEIMRDVKPTQATLVPDEAGANTSDHGWNINKENADKLGEIISELKGLGIRVSVFVDPARSAVEAARKIGTDRIELYTEPYASSFASEKDLDAVVAKYADAAKLADEIGLGVNAGHDLNLDNLGVFCEKVKPVKEVSIGHALIADAIEMGLSNAVKAYIQILRSVNG